MRTLLLTFTFVFIVSCQSAADKKETKKTDVPASDWVSLSPKDSFEGWHIFQNESGEKTGWSVQDGVFTFDKENASGKGNKSLLTDAVYSSFEIQFDWKLSPNSNSGFMWGVNEDKKYDHPFVTGPEIQIIDAAVYGDDPEHQRHTVGALYDMQPPSNIASKEPGAWNTYHITVNHKQNEGIVVLNGTEINRFPLSGPQWDALVEDSKFSKIPDFGAFKEGHLSLQDHPGVISYRNIKIRQL
jgi:hypothetical protein